MWRRVSCEQPLNTSQSILRLRGNLNQACGVFLRETATWPKGNLVLIPKPGRGTVSESRIPSWQRDTTGRRPPKLWEELSTFPLTRNGRGNEEREAEGELGEEEGDAGQVNENVEEGGGGGEGTQNSGAEIEEDGEEAEEQGGGQEEDGGADSLGEDGQEQLGRVHGHRLLHKDSCQRDSRPAHLHRPGLISNPMRSEQLKIQVIAETNEGYRNSGINQESEGALPVGVQDT